MPDSIVTLPQVRLSRPPTPRLRRGHPWIFSNELAAAPRAIAPGSLVDVLTPAGEFFGRGYYNLQSQIRVRLLSHRSDPIDTAWFASRIGAALALRQRLFPGAEAYRLIFGEGDRLPGLVVDRYGDVLVAQFLTAGMQALCEPIREALVAACQPRYIIARNDAPMRQLEGLPLEVTDLYGERPERVTIGKNGLRFDLDVQAGQKTGFFLDQSENYTALAPLSSGARVLDGFCYTGAWGLHAAHYGAREVLGLDSSAPAVERARENARLNGMEAVCRFEQADLFDALRKHADRGERFDLVIIDPPAFAKSKEKIREALRGYREINRQAFRLLAPGGFLVSCSCSYQVGRELFLEALAEAAKDSRRDAALLEWRGQSRDHPVLLAAPESAYLKCAVMRCE